jgi:hypothetical protein
MRVRIDWHRGHCLIVAAWVLTTHLTTDEEEPILAGPRVWAVLRVLAATPLFTQFGVVTLAAHLTINYSRWRAGSQVFWLSSLLH